MIYDGGRILFRPLQPTAERFSFDLQVEHHRNAVRLILFNGFAGALRDQLAKGYRLSVAALIDQQRRHFSRELDDGQAARRGILVEEGMRVQKGQLLAQLDDEAARNKLMQADATLKKAHALATAAPDSFMKVRGLSSTTRCASAPTPPKPDAATRVSHTSPRIPRGAVNGVRARAANSSATMKPTLCRVDA